MDKDITTITKITLETSACVRLGWVMLIAPLLAHDPIVPHKGIKKFFESGNGDGVNADPISWHGQPFSILVTFPPLSVVFFKPV